MATQTNNMKNEMNKPNQMTKEQLQEILDKVWVRDWSSDDAVEVIWGKCFEGYTQKVQGDE
jgi:hypothetical protein